MPMPELVLSRLMAHAILADRELTAELAPTGRLRVAIAVGPAPSAVYAVRAGGALRGVPVALAEALAAATGLPIEFVPFPSSGEIQATAARGLWDVSFLPVDEERRRHVDFGAAYHTLQSSYLVPAGSPIRRLAEADAPDVRIVGVRNSATLRASLRASPRASHVPVESPEDAVAMMHGGLADAIAMGREVLSGLVAQIEGSRILPGSFLSTTTAVAVPKGRPAALACVTALIEEAKAAGLVQQALERVGLAGARRPPAAGAV
ncbi:transporter substrate-binding domain-containing protein [Rhodoplanes azumiensis]|uniref:Transporter substrate-binding domain-containing protein n=1 Tax=Rhodoplanes azumiensis TaxID=1897628 RepID=A0ABW5AQL5_9BRAD